MVFTRAVFFRVAWSVSGQARENNMPVVSPAPSSDRTVVKLSGGLDFAAAQALREELIVVLRRGTGLLILDLSHVLSCDAAGLAVLIGTQRRARLLGTTMRLLAPSLPVTKALRSTGLDRNFSIVESYAPRTPPKLPTMRALFEVTGTSLPVGQIWGTRTSQNLAEPC